MTPQHRPAPFVALIAGVGLSLWVVVNAGMHTAVSQPMRIPQPLSAAALEAVPAAPMPSPGPELTIELR